MFNHLRKKHFNEQNIFYSICFPGIDDSIIFIYIRGGIIMKNKFFIHYFSKSDGKKIKRPYDPSNDMQHEFIARTGNLCKRYWDAKKDGLRTANAPWTISVRK
jgi:hypothetical protein